MIEIKNKIYNSKERKKQISFNKYMTLKKTIRLKFKNLIPLNENEKILYTDEYEFKDRIEKIDKGKYFAFNKRIHILSVIHKNEIDNFYYGFDSLVKKNPSKNSFSRIILDDRLKNSILSYKNKINSGGWINLGYISPKSSNLLNVVDYFHIFMFNLSDDYIGVSFVATLNECLNKELNEIMISSIPNETNYHKYYVGNKKYINKNSWSKNIIRKNKVDDLLLEIKMRCYDFLNSYINLFPINNSSPITLDEYSTNYELTDNSYLLRCYDFYIFKEEQISKNLDIIVNHGQGENFKQTFEKVDFYFECGYKNDNNRSARLLISIPKENNDNFFEDSSLLAIYKCILNFYFNIELEKYIVKKREILNNTFKSKKYSIYDDYINVNKMINIYNSILCSIDTDTEFDEYNNDKISRSLKYQNERYQYLIDKNKELDREFSNILMAKSSKSSLNLSRISIILALLSLIVTMLFSILSYTENNNNKNKTKENENIINDMDK